MLNLTTELCPETIRLAFQEYAPPQGKLQWRGRTINPAAIRPADWLAAEGGSVDICSGGQTRAAHELCNRTAPFMKQHQMPVGVGHYGVFGA